MPPDVDNSGIFANVRCTRRKGKPAIERTHVLEELEILCVDRVDRRQTACFIENRVRYRVVIYLVLRGELVIEVRRRHVRIRPELQNAVDIVVYRDRRLCRLPDVARLCGRGSAGESVHGGAYRVNIPHIPGIRYESRLPRAQELVCVEIFIFLALAPENRLKEPSLCHFFTPLNTYSPHNPAHR